jgi:capsular polysaccharide biosynthesis protein
MSNLALSRPEYKKDAAEEAQIDNQLDTMTKDLRAKASARVQAQIRSDLERTSQAESQLNEQLRPMVEAATGSTSRKQRASDLAADILRLQTSFAAVDEQWHSMMLDDASTGNAFLVTAAGVPVHPAKAMVVRNTALIVLAGMMLAMLAAVIANKLDSRIYIGADVERVVGYPPMAQIPDFRDVSEGVAEEHLLRLAAALEHARQGGDLKRCIFTGAGPEAGVSTVVIRMREMLVGMGRPIVLVDASGTPPLSRADAAAGTEGLRGAQRSSRTTALLQQMEAEAESQGDTLVLTDTAPLVVSAETEYLARFVDCVLVVIESGATTRAQLRAVASTLQRLNVAAVGFVLNRVGLKKADRAFRLSVQAIEKHLYVQGLLTARQTLRTNAIKIADVADTEQFASGSAARAQGQSGVAETAARKTGAPMAETVAAALRQAASDTDRRATAHIAQKGPGLVGESAPHRSLRVVLDSSVEIAAFRSAPQVDAEVPHSVDALQQREEPIAREEAALPWWLDDLLSRSEANLAAAREQPPIVGEPLPGGGAVQRFPISAEARGEGLAAKDLDAPPQSWEQVPNKYEASQKAEPVEKPSEEEVETTPSDLSSKLGGLRNFLFVMGMKRQNKAAEQPAVEAAPEPPVEAAAKRPIMVRTITGSTETIVPVASNPVASAPPPSVVREETARTAPEQAEGTRAMDSTPEDDGSAEPDEVQILPSWRGQYKKTK